jgi:hypothetical protein
VAHFWFWIKKIFLNHWILVYECQSLDPGPVVVFTQRRHFERRSKNKWTSSQSHERRNTK